MAKLSAILDTPPRLKTLELTPCELRVARMFGVGMMHKSIADELGVSLKTVEKHIQGAHQKLRTHNAIQMARKLILLTHLAVDEFLQPSLISDARLNE